MNPELSRIGSLVDDDGTTVLAGYTYLGLNRTAQVDFPEPGTRFTWLKQTGDTNPDPYNGWDRFGRAVDLRWMKGSAYVERIQHGYDRASNRLYRKNGVANASKKQDELYDYDGLYQLKEFQRGELNGTHNGMTGTIAAEEDFTFDPTGNWNAYVAQAGGSTVSQTRTHNAANELTAIDSSSTLVAEDAAGNMTKVPKPDNWGAGYDLKYDAWNRLVEVKNSGGSTVATYGYDGLNRRITKTVGSNTRHYYYTDQWQIIEERVNTSTSPDRQFVWGLRYTDDLILRDRGSERLYVVQDYFQPTAVTDEAGDVLERYGYEAYGTTRVMDLNFDTQTAGSSYEWETRFGAYRWDAETNLYQVRNRYLHPKLGRWVSRDPIGESGGYNLYLCVGNTPTNYIDALGLQFPGGIPIQIPRPINVPPPNWPPNQPWPPPQPPGPGTGPGGPNGCGAAGGTQYRGNYGLWDFTPACNGHDICYGTCGSSKEDCDIRFLADMLSICSSYILLPSLGAPCAGLAAIYYAAVMAGGQDAFDAAQACCPGAIPPATQCSQCGLNSPPVMR
jgi:RHS repeat-associated protein